MHLGKGDSDMADIHELQDVISTRRQELPCSPKQRLNSALSVEEMTERVGRTQDEEEIIQLHT